MVQSIIITVSAGRENGYRHWLRNFLETMDSESGVYWFRMANQPKIQPLHVYLCIGGKIRYRAKCVDAMGPAEVTFNDGREMYGKAWVRICGPVERPPEPIPRKGFQGFRYTEELF